MLFNACLLLFLGFVAAFEAPRALTRTRYDGYKVYNVVPTDRDQLAVLHNMMLHDSHVDFWREPARIGDSVEFMVSPEHQTGVVTKLRRGGIPFTVQINDVQQELMIPMWNELDLHRATKDPRVFDLMQYNTLEDINIWMDSLVSQCRAGLTCEIYSIGSSIEGREIRIFKISKPDAGRKAYWLDATIHAREWIATATIVNVLDTLAKGSVADAVRLTDTYDWYILPVMNPDGYSYTWTNTRLWRKNRAPVGGGCYGVDLNRNFDFRWGNDGVSHSPCDDTYCGVNGGSELETQAVSAELIRLGPTLGASVTIHSYGNMWMFPWGNTINYAGQTCELSADHDELMVVADATANAIEATWNTKWARGNSCVVIYATTGGTDDYAKGVAGIKNAFCPELRGNNFSPAASQIPYSVQEFWNGIVAMVDSIQA